SPYVWDVPPAISPPAQAGQLAMGRLFGIPEIKLAHLTLTSGLGRYDFPGEELVAGPQRPATAIGLEDDGANYFPGIEGSSNDLSNLQTLREIVASIRKLVPSVSSLDINTPRKNVRVSFEAAENHRLAMPLAHQSEGFRRFLAHLLALNQIPSKATA